MLDSNRIKANNTHYRFLDGMRGLSALYVVLSHAMFVVAKDTRLPLVTQQWSRIFFWGHFAVVIFIVLSGYCLMLPVVQSHDSQLRGGLSGFIKRRAKRILPPYYAALLLSLVLIAIMKPENKYLGSAWTHMLPAFTTGVILSHLFLIHNLNSDWLPKINSPMWSVATEWQIYFVFGLILLPIWRRFGIIVTMLVAFIFGYIPHYALHRFDLACPWLLGEFSLGMAAAYIAYSKNVKIVSVRDQCPWGLATVSAFILVATLQIQRYKELAAMHIDPFVGIATCCLILFCAEASKKDKVKRPLILQLFESPMAVQLGIFSYSLYLTHVPLLCILHLALASLPFHISGTVTLVIMLSIVVPICVGIAFMFYLAFEKSFTSSSKSSKAILHLAAPQGVAMHQMDSQEVIKEK